MIHTNLGRFFLSIVLMPTESVAINGKICNKNEYIENITEAWVHIKVPKGIDACLRSPFFCLCVCVCAISALVAKFIKMNCCTDIRCSRVNENNAFPVLGRRRRRNYFHKCIDVLVDTLLFQSLHLSHDPSSSFFVFRVNICMRLRLSFRRA